jgi:putative PIN family toxin of toxin-antitoxin system
MQKIVVDTNIIVSAMISRDGNFSRKIIEQVFNSRVIPIIGEALFNEYWDVFNRNSAFQSCVLSEQERLEFLQAFIKCCLWIRIYYRWRPNLKDEGDNHIIELAVAGGAQYIITKNLKDLKSGELVFNAIKIVTPDEYIKDRLWEQ